MVFVVADAASAAPPKKGSGATKAAKQARLDRQDTAKAARRARELEGVSDDGSRQLDGELRRRATTETAARSIVIIELKPGFEASSAQIKGLGGKMGRRLRSFNGQVVELSNAQLKKLAKNPAVASIHHDRATFKHNDRTAVTLGVRAAQIAYGYTGAGVGVAIIDSGVTNWHDDLTGPGVYPYGNQRVAAFVDFVNGQPMPYDDNGHGTHVAGTIAGNGYDSDGKQAGMAPGAHLVVLKVLDQNGNGTISNIIAALDYAVAHKAEHNIRVINMSVGAGINESYETDPLTLAAKRAVDAGIVVVTAAGNLGRVNGVTRYGTITAPGNAPWVLTVGASSTQGTVDPTDDIVAGYSSRGPTRLDYLAKPDILAPGTGTVSLSDPTSKFFSTKELNLVPGSVSTAYLPYLSLSGTSMSSPAVAGVVALMVEANPALTPNLVKALLQYTAHFDPNYNVLTEGAGFANANGAIELARFFATALPGDSYPSSPDWSRQLIWGNYLLDSGYILPTANAWQSNVVWGSAFDSVGDNVVWGSSAADNVVWGSNAADNVVWGSSVDSFDNVVWGSSSADNVVWGSDCGGSDCDNVVWGSSTADNVVWGSNSADNVVWGSGAADDNVVWGSSGIDLDNVVWGSSNDDNVVWGSSAVDNIVWGSTIVGDLVPTVGDNIVWGSGIGVLPVSNPAPPVSVPSPPATIPASPVSNPVPPKQPVVTAPKATVTVGEGIR